MMRVYNAFVMNEGRFIRLKQVEVTAEMPLVSLLVVFLLFLL